MEKVEMNIKSKTIAGIFCEKESNEVVSELVLKILTEGEEKHEKRCDHKKKCKGEQYYILKELQRFLNETPISNNDQIGVIACVRCYCLRYVQSRSIERVSRRRNDYR